MAPIDRPQDIATPLCAPIIEPEAFGAPSPVALVWHLAAEGKRGGGGGGRGGTRKQTPKMGLLSDDELKVIEETYADGITAVAVVDIFVTRGVRFSEATFRKYVQQGLVPRSRRVGRKGKHRGSLGVYPAKTVRRINAIKRLMQDGYTIEEIQAQFLRYTDLIESLEQGLGEAFERLGTDIDGPGFDTKVRRSLKRDLAEARKVADDLMQRIDSLSRQAVQPQGERIRSTGAAGSAEDLL